MSDERLPAAVEASGLIRRVAANGDFATILRNGDPDRGALLLVISSRGRHVGCLERTLTLDGTYPWQSVGPSESSSSKEIHDFLAKRTRFDADLWAIELDIADAERFIAETTALG
ncbi:MAG: DUF1491 family protein [Sphingomicrobium sp.]